MPTPCGFDTYGKVVVCGGASIGEPPLEPDEGIDTAEHTKPLCDALESDEFLNPFWAVCDFIEEKRTARDEDSDVNELVLEAEAEIIADTILAMADNLGVKKVIEDMIIKEYLRRKSA